MKYIIIGAGVAGVSTAKEIKKSDPSAEVILFGEERFLPYRRPLLTEFLCDSIDSDKLFYASVQLFEELGIKLRKGEHVKSIDPENKTIKLFHNEIVGYDKLLIATGGNPALGPVLRPFKRNIQRYYSLEDILLIKKELDTIENCVVFGEGLSTLDLMCGFCNLGKKITYIVKGSKAHFPLVESEFEEDLHDFLVKKGIEIIADDRIVSIEKANGKFQVLTLNQKKLTADLVFAWDYYKPNIEIIKGTKIEKKLGILVDQRLRTSVEDIYAAGDCVEIYHPKIRDYWINFGFPNATEQGKIAGRNMAGGNEAYQVKEMLVFNLMGKKLRARWWE